MNNRILVTYATRYDSTRSVAKAIGEALATDGTPVDVRTIKLVDSLDNYSAVVVGSAIRVGAWLPEAVEFVEAHQETLRRIPTAFFTVCITLAEDTEANREVVDAYLDPIRAIVEPVAVESFAGKMDLKRLPLPLRMLLRVRHVPQGDFRDWEAISNWALDIRPLLARETMPG